jgi:DNA-binding transcriptional ArsR family regulator
MVVPDGSKESRLVVSAASRTLRRQLRALGWVTLEEVALDAVAEDGQLVARTSARQVAERLRLDPRAVARELKALRDRGLVRLEPDQGEIGRRFGLWVYVLGPLTGLTVIDARATPSPPPSLSAPGPEPFDLGRGSL